MNSRKLLLLVFVLCLSFTAFSQKINDKKLQLIPYLGLNSPQGDFKNKSSNGSVIGLSIDKYLNSKFALGVDFNYQTNPFLNSFDYSIISPPSSLSKNEDGPWTNTTVSFGPTYTFGTKKITSEVYTKAGISMVKSPSASVVLSHPAIPNFDLFDLREQKISSFGLTSGVRFNYKINEKLSLFVNPQYVISGAEINYFYKDPVIGYIAPNPDLGVEGSFDPGLVSESLGVDEVIKPSHFNLNFGVKIDLSSKNKKTSVNRNLPGCSVRLRGGIECLTYGPQVYILSEWWGQNINSLLSIKIYDGNTLVYSGNTITANNQILGAGTGTRTHFFMANGYEGRTLRCEISIDDQYGAIVCYKNDLLIPIPNCVYQTTCGIDYSITCDSSTRSSKINVSSTWRNIPVGQVCELKYTVINTTTNTSIPYSSSPNLPLQISGTGTAIHNLFINGYNNVPIKIMMEIINATTGAVICSQEVTQTLPNCEFSLCELKLNSAICNNGNSSVDFSVNWTNYPTFNQYSIIAEMFDSSGGLIQSFPAYTLNAASGTANFNAFLPPNLAGTTITVKSRICELGGIKKCCDSKLIIDVPKCCESCNNVTIKDNTNLNQNNLSDFVIEGIITSNSSGITKITTQLESISFNNHTGTVSAPNFEFRAGTFFGAGSSNSILIGSLTGRRSKIMQNTFSTSNPNSLVFRLFIDNYIKKRIVQYRVKFTIFKKDGTYCEKIIDYKI